MSAKQDEKALATNQASEVSTSEVVDVFFDESQEGVTGSKLAGEGRPQLFKLDHKKGHLHPIDDDTERYDSLLGVIVNARTYYRRFGPSGVVCESDNGQEGYDNDLKKKIKCRPTLGADGKPTFECGFSFAKDDFVGNGKCSLGLQIQMVAMLDGQATPIQLNMSASSAREFSKYLDKLKRKNLKMRGVTTKVSSKYIKGRQNQYYAGKFEVEDEDPCVDISELVNDPPQPEAQEV